MSHPRRRRARHLGLHLAPGHPVSRPDAPLGTGPRRIDLDSLYAELRALAGPVRAAVDALVAAWYLEVRSRTGRSFEGWNAAVVREVAAALVCGGDPRPGCGHLGVVRAAQGASEAELREDILALEVVARSDPTLNAFPAATELIDVALAGWSTASRVDLGRGAECVPDGDGRHLVEVLRRTLVERSAPAPIVIVVDASADATPGAQPEALREALAASSPGGLLGGRWFELTPGVRYAAVVRRDAASCRFVAGLRGMLRVAPELTGLSCYVWIEPVPAAASAVPDFVQRVAGTHSREVHRSRRDRPRPISRHRVSRATVGGRRSGGHRRWQIPSAERVVAVAATLLVAVLGVRLLEFPGTHLGEGMPADAADPGSSPVPGPVPDERTVISPPSGADDDVAAPARDVPGSPGSLDSPGSPGSNDREPVGEQIEIAPQPIAHTRPVHPPPSEPDPAPSPPETPDLPVPSPPLPAGEPEAEPSDSPEVAPRGQEGVHPPAHVANRVPAHVLDRGAGAHRGSDERDRPVIAPRGGGPRSPR